MTKSTKPPEVSEKLWNEIRSSRSLRVKLATESLYWFFHIYFGHYITYATAEFQKDIINKISDDNIDHLVIIAFRESGKSSIVSTVYPIWAMIGQMQKKYIVLVSQNQNLTQQHLRNLRSEIEANELFRGDFGNLEAESQEWGISALTMPRFGTRIEAISREQGVRGTRSGAYRPDLIICDDIEDTKSIRQQKERNKTHQWYTAEILALGSVNTKVVMVGNLLHKDSLPMRLIKAFDTGEQTGEHVSYPVVNERGDALWLGKYPDKTAVERHRKKIGHRVTWQREYMLNIVPDDEQIITSSMIQPYDVLPKRLQGQYWLHAISIDIAVSERDTADYTAIVQLIQVGRRSDVKIYVKPLPFNKRMKPHKTMNKIRELAELHPKAKIIIESTAAQVTFTDFAKEEGINVTGFSPRDDKRTRLTLIADKIANGTILFPRQGCEELISQLIGFETETHDDLVDALTMGVLELSRSERKTGTATFVRGPRGGVVAARARSNRRRKSIIDDDPYGWD